MSPPLKLLIFDWDGTLVDSVDHIVATVRAASSELGLPQRYEAAIRAIIGLGLHEAVTRLYPQHDPDWLQTRLVKAYRKHFYSGPGGSIFPGVPATLSHLASEGYSLAVATGKSREGLDEGLRHTGLDSYFAVTRCASETASKPDPAMLHEILEVTGLAAEQALMIGDSVHDLNMARGAGMAALAVAGGAYEPASLAQLEPVDCLSRVTDLPSWLAAQGHSAA